MPKSKSKSAKKSTRDPGKVRIGGTVHRFGDPGKVRMGTARKPF